jgi:hypothetical protein
MSTDFQQTMVQATQAYLNVWRDHKVGFSPPVTAMRDRAWSEMLRAAWPSYTSVDVRPRSLNGPNYAEMRRWCDQQPSGYWVNGGGDRWYFERRDIAAAFKLTFGGA